MIFTFFYMYATFLQWWRLGILRNKLNGTLNSKNALLLTNSKIIHTSKRQRSIENLLFHIDDRIACTIVPKQIVNLSHWVLFPKDPRSFPIHIKFGKCILKPPFVHIMVRSHLDSYTKHDSEVIQIEKFGELIAWKAANKFEVLLKTDTENLTKLVQCYWNSTIDINHSLQMLEIETVNIDGNANRIKYDRKYSLGERLKYSHSQVHWKKFANDVKELYLKIRENSNPKIKIENGSTKNEDLKKVPVYEARPIKKESKKIIEDKNTLEVSGSDHRRHKSGEKRDKSADDKHKERKSRDETSRTKDLKTETTKIKNKNIPSKSELASKNNEKLNHNENLNDDNKVELQEQNKTEHTTKTKSKEIKKDKNKESNVEGIKSKERASTSKTKEQEIKEKRSESKETAMKQNGDLLTANIGENEPKLKETKTSPKISSDGQPKHTKNVKPPNILIYADSVTAKENVKIVLNSVINNEKYIIYDLPTNLSTNSAWSNTTVLVVICGATTPEVTSHLLNYLVNGGQLLCLCSDLLHSILSVFSTAEVREHELVRFSYGEWKRVKMMHHIFCYQASPAKKQFSKDSVESNHSNGSSPIAPRTPSIAEIQHNGKNYTLQVQVLGTEETWQTPSLLLANVKNSKGRAIFSQVHLEIDPLQYEDDENKFTALKDSNQARLEILTDILKNRLDIDCTRIDGEIKYTPAYLLGRHEMKTDLFNECKEIVDNTLHCENITMVFCGKNVNPGVASAVRLPIMIYSCPSTFSTVDYFSTLKTDEIGRLVIYADILTCSQYLLNKTIRHGIVVIPRQQSAAKGRANNTWLSPIGSACFSLQLHVPLSSPLGRMLSLVQQLITVAIVEALNKNSGYENLDIGIKWPNDIYINKSIKLGGLLTNSTIGNRIAVLNIGCGFNLDNSEPTISLNDYINEYNIENKTNIEKLTKESYYASVFNEIETLYDIVQNDNVEYFYELYYKYWIHKDAKIKVTNEEGNTHNATVVGIDDFGFLKVKLENGEIKIVHPDGNSFDMTKGLIVPKVF